MVTLRDSLLSSSARKLPIRMRPDLVCARQHYLGRSYWIVKDPVGLNYFRFQEEEFAILQMLDGETNLDDIKDRFEDEFPPQKITLEELQQFLGTLHRSGLVVADLPGQGRQLCKRRGERRRKQFLAAISNILCIRCKGFDPERLLNWLYPKLRWFYSPWTVALLPAAGPLGRGAGDGAVRGLPLAAARLPPVLQRPQRLPADGGVGRARRSCTSSATD